MHFTVTVVQKLDQFDIRTGRYRCPHENGTSSKDLQELFLSGLNGTKAAQAGPYVLVNKPLLKLSYNRRELLRTFPN